MPMNNVTQGLLMIEDKKIYFTEMLVTSRYFLIKEGMISYSYI